LRSSRRSAKARMQRLPSPSAQFTNDVDTENRENVRNCRRSQGVGATLL
jgi:hypothetical protein